MKVYVVSSDSLSGIAVANLLNRRQNMNAIVSESGMEGYDDEIEDVGRNVGENFDYILLVSAEPYRANIDINKLDDARAIICRSRSDISAASSGAKANVIIFDRSRGRNQLLELVEDFIDIAYEGVATEYAEDKTVDKVREKTGLAVGLKGLVKGIGGGMPQPKRKAQAEAHYDQKRKKAKEQEEEPDEDEEENEEEEEDSKRKYSGKGGLVGRIKYTFGLE